jgi:hypothetical protein
VLAWLPGPSTSHPLPLAGLGPLPWALLSLGAIAWAFVSLDSLGTCVPGRLCAWALAPSPSIAWALFAWAVAPRHAIAWALCLSSCPLLPLGSLGPLLCLRPLLCLGSCRRSPGRSAWALPLDSCIMLLSLDSLGLGSCQPRDSRFYRTSRDHRQHLYIGVRRRSPRFAVIHCACTHLLHYLFIHAPSVFDVLLHRPPIASCYLLHFLAVYALSTD